MKYQGILSRGGMGMREKARRVKGYRSWRFRIESWKEREREKVGVFGCEGEVWYL